jgi:hypothetical protein
LSQAPAVPVLPGGLVYRIASFDGSALRVLGGRNLSRPETVCLALTFSGVSYIACPVYFGHAKLRLGTSAERRQLEEVTRFEPELEEYLFAIEGDTPGVFRWQVYFIVAQAVRVETLTVPVAPADGLSSP